VTVNPGTAALTVTSESIAAAAASSFRAEFISKHLREAALE
jgi:hypothetical protein